MKKKTVNTSNFWEKLRVLASLMVCLFNNTQTWAQEWACQAWLEWEAWQAWV